MQAQREAEDAAAGEADQQLARAKQAEERLSRQVALLQAQKGELEQSVTALEARAEQAEQRAAKLEKEVTKGRKEEAWCKRSLAKELISSRMAMVAIMHHAAADNHEEHGSGSSTPRLGSFRSVQLPSGATDGAGGSAAAGAGVGGWSINGDSPLHTSPASSRIPSGRSSPRQSYEPSRRESREYDRRSCESFGELPQAGPISRPASGAASFSMSASGRSDVSRVLQSGMKPEEVEQASMRELLEDVLSQHKVRVRACVCPLHSTTSL